MKTFLIIILVFVLIPNGYGQTKVNDYEYLTDKVYDTLKSNGVVVVKKEIYKKGVTYISFKTIKDYQPIDSTKYLYHKFLYFMDRLNDPKLSRKNFDMMEDSAHKYYRLLYKYNKKNK